jgi:hypothetical protein
LETPAGPRNDAGQVVLVDHATYGKWVPFSVEAYLTSPSPTFDQRGLLSHGDRLARGWLLVAAGGTVGRPDDQALGNLEGTPLPRSGDGFLLPLLGGDLAIIGGGQCA